MGQYGPDKVPASRKGHNIDAHYCWIIADYCARRLHYSSWGSVRATIRTLSVWATMVKGLSNRTIPTL
jgi:hypothetical protein